MWLTRCLCLISFYSLYWSLTLNFDPIVWLLMFGCCCCCFYLYIFLFIYFTVILLHAGSSIFSLTLYDHIVYRTDYRVHPYSTGTWLFKSGHQRTMMSYFVKSQVLLNWVESWKTCSWFFCQSSLDDVCKLCCVQWMRRWGWGWLGGWCCFWTIQQTYIRTLWEINSLSSRWITFIPSQRIHHDKSVGFIYMLRQVFLFIDHDGSSGKRV